MVAMLSMVGNSPDVVLIKFTYLAERLAKKDYYIKIIRWIRELFQSGHPSLIVAKKILRDTHPAHRQQLVKSFFINQLLLGTNKRKEFQDKNGFYPPGFIVISPSMLCNLKCFGCYSGNYIKDKGLSVEVIDRILYEANEMGIYFAVISGGEPFFRKDLLDVFERHKEMAFHVFTHGGLLDEKLIDRIVNIGNIVPAISIEGYEEDTDLRRGKGHYAAIMKAMDLLSEAGVLFGFSATQTSKNTDTITSDRFIDMMAEKGCTLGWFFSYCPVGREPNLDLMPRPEQRDLLRERLKYFRSTKPILLADFWNDGPLVGGCLAAGRRYLHINANGDIEPCVFAHYAVDNIHNTTMQEALKSKLFTTIKDRLASGGNLYKPCMLIDRPEVWREAVFASGARPTHEGAETLVTTLSDAMDKYAVEYGRLANPAWEQYLKENDEQHGCCSTDASAERTIVPSPDHIACEEGKDVDGFLKPAYRQTGRRLA